MSSSKRRRLGRRERNQKRRKAKAAALLGDDGDAEGSETDMNAEAIDISGSDSCAHANQSTATPNIERPAMAHAECDAKDLACVTHQLGFTPSNLVHIAARDARTGEPTVVLLYPLTRPAPERRRGGADKDWEPFPTTFWLTCPALKARVSALEDARWVEKIEKRLAEATPIGAAASVIPR